MENETKQTNTNEQEPDIFAQKLREDRSEEHTGLDRKSTPAQIGRAHV